MFATRSTTRRFAFLMLLGIGVTAAAIALGRRSCADGGRPTGSVAVVPPVPLASSAQPTKPGTVTVEPTPIDDVLTNPGMGFASFHFGWWCNLPPITYPPAKCAERVLKNWPERYPMAGTAYFRWHWREIEPERGQIDFAMIDAAIQSANRLGMTLGFRVMTVEEGKAGLPEWLMRAPYEVAGKWRAGGGGDTFWPDYRDATFQREHERLVEALAERYDGHPAVDHIDIGTVGCWGEWNTACISDVDSIIDVYEPSGGKERKRIVEALTQLIDHHLSAFEKTPVIMLSLSADNADILAHATRSGAGWRADCWGDWGLWGGSWSHQGKVYPPMIAAATAIDPGFPEVWKTAPVHLEICGTLDRWQARGWTAAKPDGEVHRSFQWALAHHASLLNVKSKPVPEIYVEAIDDLLRRNGYRFVIDRLSHPEAISRGATITVASDWRNVGVAPAYIPRALTYRLRGKSKSVTLISKQDTRTWLPGSWRVRDKFTVPKELPPGVYRVDVALLDRDGKSPDTKALPPLFLGISGRRTDGWYELSSLTIR